jgi:hypothetical protein
MCKLAFISAMLTLVASKEVVRVRDQKHYDKIMKEDQKMDDKVDGKVTVSGVRDVAAKRSSAASASSIESEEKLSAEMQSFVKQEVVRVRDQRNYDKIQKDNQKMDDKADVKAIVRGVGNVDAMQSSAVSADSLESKEKLSAEMQSFVQQEVVRDHNTYHDKIKKDEHKMEDKVDLAVSGVGDVDAMRLVRSAGSIDTKEKEFNHMQAFVQQDVQAELDMLEQQLKLVEQQHSLITSQIAKKKNQLAMFR